MKQIWTWVKQNPNRTMFLIPIILVAGISISHVVAWYNIANPISWAVYLSIAIEVGAMTALVAATNKIKGGVWFMFGLITLIQMIGNIFFSYKEIDENGELFKSWIELSSPIWEALGTEPGDIISLKRWLAFLEGGLLPIISLTSLHFFVKYEGKPNIVESVNDQITDSVTQGIGEDVEPMIHPDAIENGVYETSKIVNEFKENETKKVWDRVRELREEGKLPTPTQEDLEDEPTALAFTPYVVEVETPIVETFFSEEEYLDLQENQTSVSDPVNDTVNDTVNEGVNEGATEGATEGVIDGTESVIETTETINDNIRGILDEIGDEGIIEGIIEGITEGMSVKDSLFWAETTENTEIQTEVVDEESHDNIRRLSYVKDSQR